MTTLADAKFAALRTQGRTGAMPEMTMQWLRANGATTDDKSLDAAWRAMLTQQLGITKAQFTQRNDMWFQLLGNRGHTGSLSDRELAFWRAGGTFPAPGADDSTAEECE